jgi:hypothetical protein
VLAEATRGEEEGEGEGGDEETGRFEGLADWVAITGAWAELACRLSQACCCAVRAGRDERVGDCVASSTDWLVPLARFLSDDAPWCKGSPDDSDGVSLGDDDGAGGGTGIGMSGVYSRVTMAKLVFPVSGEAVAKKGAIKTLDAIGHLGIGTGRGTVNAAS